MEVIPIPGGCSAAWHDGNDYDGDDSWLCLGYE